MSPPATGNDTHDELKAYLISTNQKLLDAIVDIDYETYDSLCADDMSCMEPESNQTVVIGKDFHKYYFDVFGGSGGDEQNGSTTTTTSSKRPRTNVTMVRPHVQFLGRCNENGVPTAAVLSYVKLTQQTKPGMAPVTIQQSETRVWEQREQGGWVNVHFHKSPYKI
mmetsp:Transcript_6742/g.16860  ORF Transcript_6742/g.16860 Transcript_6742/m.16860 type:complete len:166 (+) Transcript_6742:306-803(+)